MNKQFNYITTAAFAMGIHATSLCTEVTGSSKFHRRNEMDAKYWNIPTQEIKPFFNKNILKGILTAEQPNVDVSFAGLVQKFAKTQIELEPEFITALNNLTFKVGKKEFKKKRF